MLVDLFIRMAERDLKVLEGRVVYSNWIKVAFLSTQQHTATGGPVGKEGRRFRELTVET